MQKKKIEIPSINSINTLDLYQNIGNAIPWKCKYYIRKYLHPTITFKAIENANSEILASPQIRFLQEESPMQKKNKSGWLGKQAGSDVGD